MFSLNFLMALNSFLTCPDDCSTAHHSPAAETDQDCTKAPVYGSQLSDLVILPNGATGAADWTIAGNWTTVIDNTNLDSTKAKHLVGEGSKPESEPFIIDMPKGKKKTRKRTSTIVFTIKNVTTLHYAFGQYLQCGNTDFTFWFGNEAHFFGGQNGIIPASVNCEFVYGDGVDDIELMVITLTYESDGDPARTAAIL